MMRIIVIFLFAAGCWSQMLPPCPPYAAFLPSEMLVGCALSGPPMMPPMPPPYPLQPYPMMPPMIPSAIVNITLPKHDIKTTTPPSNKFSFPLSIPRWPMPFPPPMPMEMGPILPMGPPLPMMPPPLPMMPPPLPMMPPPLPMSLPSPMIPVRQQKQSKDHISSKQSKNFGVTPVLSYVTRDGHVIYKKTLSDVEALRWLKKEIKKIRFQKINGGKREDGNGSDSNKTAGEEESKS